MADEVKTGIDGLHGLLDGVFRTALKTPLGSVVEGILTTPEGQDAARKIVTEGIQTVKTAAGEISRSAQIALLEARLKTLRKTP